MTDQTFREFMLQRFQSGGFSTDDMLATLLPLCHESLEAHEAGLVAPLIGTDALHVSNFQAWFQEAARKQETTNLAVLSNLARQSNSAFEIVGEFDAETDVDTGARDIDNLGIGEFDQKVDRPMYLPDYTSWEHEIGHHDPLTDIFSLGMLMASLVTGLDFQNDDSLETFVASRGNLFALAPTLHPVVARAIYRMTELDRHKRVQDLSAVINTLANYREQEADIEFELASIEGFETKDHRTKQAVVLAKLKQRLFDISKRNRLLNFRATMQSVNLTQASVPLSFNLATIKADQLLVWNKSFHKKVCAEKPISLNSFLNFSEAIYLPGLLDRIVAEARRDAAEFGMAQLRLAICFLSWANLKEKPVQQFESPLLLLPVRLKKKRGITDKYSIEVLEPIAEVNPVVRHQFKELYEIDLPESIDLDKTDVDQFYDFLSSHIENSHAGITLHKIEKPHVSIVHEKAKRRLDQYRRRARLSGRGMRNFMDLDYSYDPANYHPLGVRIFANFVQPTSLHLREIVESASPPKKSFASESETPDESNTEEVKRTVVHLGQDEANPYHWQFDLCNVTLANFKYRKMSLVRDYDILLEEPRDNPSFDSVFSLKPQKPAGHEQSHIEYADRFDVVPCDPTQASSIARARAGQSYIIQGPPGTGKSQTIANLIADQVAKGKRVLFVCEKRAAIDVVYSRLKQCGLEKLCCLIHDSQTDKKEFVMDLKASYEEFMDLSNKRSSKRPATLKALNKSRESLHEFHNRMNSTSEDSGLPIRRLLERCLELEAVLPELDPVERERLPRYREWYENAEQLEELNELIQTFQDDGILSRHPLAALATTVVNVEHPMGFVKTRASQAISCLKTIAEKLGKCGIPESQWQTLEQAKTLTEFAERILPFAENNQLDLLDPNSESAIRLREMIETEQAANSTLQSCKQLTGSWNQKIPSQDLPTAVAQAQGFKGSFFAWLSPAWWRLRGVMNRSYDFGAHTVRPNWVTVLEGLEQEYEAEENHKKVREGICDKFSLADFDQQTASLSATSYWFTGQPEWLQKIFRALAKSDKATSIATKLSAAGQSVSEFETESVAVLESLEQLSWSELQNQLESIEGALESVPDFLSCLKRMESLPSELTSTIRQAPFTFAELESVIADETYQSVLRGDPSFSRFNFAEHESAREKLYASYYKWLDANAAEIVERQRGNFLKHIELSEQSASALSPDEKEFKKRYRKGCRELEHEFGKSMRYKPIRDLMANESGDVVNDLKPVWLMSPLSVSDTLPLSNQLVDVVIFDEASQVTLEEAIPTIFRGPQAIVVGDEMQLPPTDFFSSKKSNEEDELEFEEAGEMIQYDLGTNSLLNHSAKNLPGTMLGWHYRSRSESLISFSNRAFYQGRLLTVPEDLLNSPSQHPIKISDPADGCENAGEIWKRPVSFHMMKTGRYDNRRNRTEADYIANVIKGLLDRNANSKDPRSIGVVAFSEAQQNEIEQALDRLAQQDSEFRTLLDLELEREVDDQHVGLLVKNLENIQGDERDIILLSVCYGQNKDGNIRMNFGPINKSGGEKRLNVAFSRAKQNMCIVSSMTGSQITNDYNDGARCLKHYLSYAEAASVGDQDGMNAILNRLSLGIDLQHKQVSCAVTKRIAKALTDRGFMVDSNVGQSHFQCDLAIRSANGERYQLGILVDDQDYYALNDTLERDVMRPKLLQAFGWQVALVLSKDLHRDSDAVMERLLKMLTK